MQCTQCGSPVTPTTKFCSNCGTKVVTAPAPQPLETYRALLERALYVQVREQLRTASEPALKSLHTEAEAGFATALAELIKRASMPRWVQRPFDREQALQLREDLVQRTTVGSALSDLREAGGYYQVLIQRAQTDEAGRTPREQRGMLYAALALATPIQSAAVEQLIAQYGLNPTVQPTRRLDLNELPEAGSVPVDRPSLQASEPTRPIETPTQPLDTAQRDAELAGLEALEQSKAAIQANQLDPAERALREATSLLGADANNQPLLDRLSKQLEALRTTIPALRQTLDQPLTNWLNDGEQLEAQVRSEIGRLSQVFAPDDPQVRALQQRFERQRTLWRATRTKLASLIDLNGAALEEMLAELSSLKQTDWPEYAKAKDRLEQYNREEDKRRQDAELRNTARLNIERGLGLKADADNIYEQIAVIPADLLSLRSNLAFISKEISESKDVTLEENPLDPETFAYYDLIFANRFRELTSLTELEMTAATKQNLGELVVAYTTQQEAVAKLEDEGESDPASRAKLHAAQQRLSEIEHLLRTKLTDDARETQAAVKALLERFDYTTAHKNLSTLRERINATGFTLDPQLDAQLTAQEQEVAELSAKQERAEALLATIDDRLSQQPPDFTAALAALDQAAQLAVWRETELRERRASLENRRSIYIDDRLQQISAYVRTGDEQGIAQANKLIGDLNDWVLSERDAERLSALRGAINQQQANREQIAQIRTTINETIEQSKLGKDIDEMAARIQGLRARLGPKDSPNLPGEVWYEFDALLSTAEQRISHWRRYRKLLVDVQQAAMNGNPAELDSVFGKIKQELGEETYLPILADMKQFRELVNTSSRDEYIRMRLTEIEKKLIDNEKSITAADIESVVRSASLSDDSSIVAISEKLKTRYLDLYRARDVLSHAIAKGDFVAFEQAYAKLSNDEQQSFARLHQEVETSRLQIGFETELEDQLRTVKPRFNLGWDQPIEFLAAVSTIRKFADQTSPARRKETPRLDPNTIGQLAGLGDLLVAARSDYDTRRFRDALNRVDLILKQIPANAVTSDHLLKPYADDLGYLRGVLLSKQSDIQRELLEYEQASVKLQGALDDYLKTVGDQTNAFLSSELSRVQRGFGTISDPRSQAHIDILKQITDLLKRVHACTDLFLKDPEDAQQDYRARKARLEAELKAIAHTSEVIRQDTYGQHWLGIHEYDRYNLVLSNIRFAEALAHADAWLRQARDARNGSTKLSRMDELRSEGEALATVLADQGASKLADANTGLGSITEAMSKQSTQVNQSISLLKKEREKLWRQNQRKTALRGFVVLLVLFVAAAAAIPRVRQPIVEAATINLIGTLTPTPSPTIDPALMAQATSDAQATIIAQTPTPTLPPTLTPTPTPIPPQEALVVFPGQISVRNRPDLSLNRTTFLLANDDVILTAYSDAPNGVRWYRVDVPAKNLMGVWLLAEADDGKGRISPTLRFFDNNGQVRPELLIPYQP